MSNERIEVYRIADNQFICAMYANTDVRRHVAFITPTQMARASKRSAKISNQTEGCDNLYGVNKDGNRFVLLVNLYWAGI